jgi:HNH endonuclease
MVMVRERREDLSSEQVRKLFSYDLRRGTLLWNTSPNGRVPSGCVAGTPNTSGHIQVKINGHRYLVHVIIWLYMTGCWPLPGYEIDHINRDKKDNRWLNLRQATKSQNKANYNLQANNTSGAKGAYLDRRYRKYRVAIGVGNRMLHLGSCYMAYLPLKINILCLSPYKLQLCQSICSMPHADGMPISG